MQIDIGNISEDIIPNGILNTEDKNANGILDESEDTGLDGLYNLYEVSYDPEQNPDPFCDDFVLPRNLSNPLDYLNIDGTEGNSILPEIGKFPDSEDLNRNNKLDIENHYYSYLVPITLNENNFLADYNEESGWGLLKIPLIDYHYTFGDPYSNSMDKIRLWFTSIEDELLINIAEIKFSKEL
jgi:cell surface protein SprA